MTPRILHVFPSFEVGGAQRRHATLVTKGSGHFIHSVFAMDGNYKALSLIPSVPTAETQPAFRRRTMVRSALACRRLLAEMRPHLLVTYNWGSVEWALGNRFRPLVPHIHIQDGFGPDEANGELWRRKLVRRLAYGGAARVIVPSETLEHIARSHWHIRDARLRRIDNGVDPGRFAGPADDHLVRRLKLDGDGPVIGTVGALRPEKNMGRLIEAVRTVADSIPTVRLVIVGDGIGRSALSMLTERIGLKENVIFAGHLDKPEDILPAFDVFALSSDTEQAPLALIEAMATGLPVAATDVGDVRTMVHPDNAPHIAGHDAQTLAGNLMTLCSDADRRTALGAANRRTVHDRFDETAMIAAYEREFDAVLGGV